MLDADAEGADWREVSRIILRIDRNVSQRALGPRSKAILSARNGSLTVGTVGCCGKDGLRLLKGLGHDNGRRASLPPAIALRYLWLGG